MDDPAYFERCATVKAVSPLTAETRVRCRSVPVGIVVVEAPLHQVFLQVFQFHPVNAPYSSLFIYLLLLHGSQTGEVWEPSRKQCTLEIQEAGDKESASMLLQVMKAVTWLESPVAGLTAETLDQARAIPYEICGRLSGSGTRLYSSTSTLTC